MLKVAIIISAIILAVWELANTALRARAGFKWSPVLYEFIYSRTHSQKQVMERALDQITDEKKYTKYINRISPYGVSDDFDVCQCLREVVDRM
jgi:hypothetical protein